MTPGAAVRRHDESLRAFHDNDRLRASRDCPRGRYGIGFHGRLIQAREPRHFAGVRRQDKAAAQAAHRGAGKIHAGHRGGVQDERRALRGSHQAAGERARGTLVHHPRPDHHRIGIRHRGGKTFGCLRRDISVGRLRRRQDRPLRDGDAERQGPRGPRRHLEFARARPQSRKPGQDQGARHLRPAADR